MRNVLFLFFVLVNMSVFAQGSIKKGLLIKGVVPKEYGIEGKKMTLMYASLFAGPQKNVPIAESIITDGKYSFSIPDLAEPALLLVQGGRMSISIAVNPGDEVTLTGREISGGATASESYNTLVRERWEQYNKGRSAVSKKHEAILEKLDKAATAKEAAELQNTEAYQRYQADMAAWNEEHGKVVTAQLKANPNSVWALICLQYHGGVMKITKEHYAMLSDELKQSIYGRSLYAYLDVCLLGKQAPDFTLNDAEGKEHSLASLLKENKYLLIDFWASWCGPCRRGIPVMRDLVQKYQKEGLAIVNISIDQKKESWLKALDEEKMTWTNLWDDKQVGKNLFGVSAIPSVFLLKADGTVLFERLYGDAIAIELKRIFGY